MRKFFAIGSEFVFVLSPGEVGIGLTKSNLGQAVHHGGLGKGLGEQHDSGVSRLNLTNNPSPKGQRLGVRIVDPEDLDTALNPEFQNL
ncbi:unannotated protein [freshwater metagenome]|uniref:Unannotated protein n=1 Tax=freshwater metagenome TaxID=449393 RepID=A0A6J6Q2H7_9ZZZZ